jgi:inner membrane protease subunit 1
MIPTIEESNAFVLIDYFSYKVMRQSFKKGDVVVALSPGYFYRPVCKRICAVEGEEVHYENPVTGKLEQLVIPPDHFWLLGDNPPLSGDSRHYGPVLRRSIRGRVFWKIWPFFTIIE